MARVKVKVAAVCVVAASMLAICAAAIAADAPARQTANVFPDQFVSLAEKIEQARAKIACISYSAIDEGDHIMGELGKRHFRSEWTILEKGPLRAATRDGTAVFADGRKPPQQIVTLAVLNDTYFARRVGEGEVDQYPIEKPGVITPSVRSQIHGDAGLSILAYGFGDGDLPFSAKYLHDPSKSAWRVKEVRSPAGEVRYELNRYAVGADASEQAESVWTIDPQQGGLITGLRRYYGGHLLIDVQVKCGEVVKGVFLPVRVRHTRYWIPTDATSKPAAGRTLGEGGEVSSVAIEFKDIVVNPKIPDDRFTMAYLGSPNRLIIHQHQPDGTLKHILPTRGKPEQP